MAPPNLQQVAAFLPLAFPLSCVGHSTALHTHSPAGAPGGNNCPGAQESLPSRGGWSHPQTLFHRAAPRSAHTGMDAASEAATEDHRLTRSLRV